MTAGYGYQAAGGEPGKLRAATADRERVAEYLNTAFVDGRLSKDEYDARLGSAFSARTYADLDMLVADLPAVPSSINQAETAVRAPVAATNGLALASLACGLAQFVVGPLATIPAIIFGHVARRQIRRSGEQGAGLALAGLMLGWGLVIVGVVAVIVGLAAFAQFSVPAPPPH